jgi:hypothetical protein
MSKKRTPHTEIITQVKIKLPFWLWELTALSSHRAQVFVERLTVFEKRRMLGLLCFLKCPHCHAYIWKEVMTTGGWQGWFFLFTDVLYQVQLQELEPDQVNPYRTYHSQTFSWCVSGYSIISGSCWQCICQPTGKWLEWIGNTCYNGDTYYILSFKSHTCTSPDTSKHQFSLQWNSVTTKVMAIFITVQDTP